MTDSNELAQRLAEAMIAHHKQEVRDLEELSDGVAAAGESLAAIGDTLRHYLARRKQGMETGWRMLAADRAEFEAGRGN